MTSRHHRGVATLALGVGLLTGVAGALVLAAPERQTIVGVVTDEMCPDTNHAAMRMGSNDEECARACAEAHGAAWVLWDGKVAYALSDQAAAAALAARKVRVTGTLDPQGKKITVETMRAEP